MITKTFEQRLWEGCGFEELPKGSRDKFKRLFAIKYPDGTIHSVYPDLTLDNLFKWAVPKVKEKLNAGGVRYPFHNFLKKWIYAIAINNEDPTESLALAIMEEIDGS